MQKEIAHDIILKRPRGNHAYTVALLGSLTKGVFERRSWSGSEVFFILKHLDDTKFAFLVSSLLL